MVLRTRHARGLERQQVRWLVASVSFLALAVVFIWGVSFVAIKLGLTVMSPFALCAWRFLLAAIPLVFFVEKPNVSWPLLQRQMVHFQPDGGSAPVVAGAAPYGRQLSGIRGLRLQVHDVRAKFKYAGKRTETVQPRLALDDTTA